MHSKPIYFFQKPLASNITVCPRAILTSDPNLLFSVVPILLVLPLFQQYFFKLTGRVYLGPLTMSIIFVIMLLSNSVYYYPL